MHGMWCSFIHTQALKIIFKHPNDVFRTAQMNGRHHNTMNLLRASVDGNRASLKKVLCKGYGKIF